LSRARSLGHQDHTLQASDIKMLRQLVACLLDKDNQKQEKELRPRLWATSANEWVQGTAIFGDEIKHPNEWAVMVEGGERKPERSESLMVYV
jgi:hypothetical protein